MKQAVNEGARSHPLVLVLMLVLVLVLEGNTGSTTTEAPDAESSLCQEIHMGKL